MKDYNYRRKNQNLLFWFSRFEGDEIGGIELCCWIGYSGKGKERMQKGVKEGIQKKNGLRYFVGRVLVYMKCGED